jgi:hypothetical protein
MSLCGQNFPKGGAVLTTKTNVEFSLSAELPPEWTHLIPNEEWRVFNQALTTLKSYDIPFALAGAFGLAHYTKRLRDTKDLDFIILPEDRSRVIELLNEIGFSDYYDLLPYDRAWIYRSHKDGLIVDVIWAMANQRAQVDEAWFHSAPVINIHDEAIHIIPVEYLLWMKIYVLQKDRSDWLDLVNLLYASVEKIDWDLLIEKLDQDLPLLTSLMQVFDWVCPRRAQLIPSTIRNQFHLPWSEKSTKDFLLERIRLLDSRPWFAALQPVDKLLQI